jgi:UDP-N-acetylmuramoyl-L-alanyl-D-glutamate--2,6-diaminopimelate ligase
VTFVIDYAHNGVSLTSVLDTLRGYDPERLICLFGSVGGRTRERRRDLAEAAAYRADLCILTADNPANEPVMDIIGEIDSHFPADGCPRIHEPDREAAIRMLVDMAQPGDIILLAGKGHETYQLIGTRRVPFSEKEILREALRERALAEIC